MSYFKFELLISCQSQLLIEQPALLYCNLPRHWSRHIQIFSDMHYNYKTVSELKKMTVILLPHCNSSDTGDDCNMCTCTLVGIDLHNVVKECSLSPAGQRELNYMRNSSRELHVVCWLGWKLNFSLDL